jgi:membrane peptidoglycan carboxypeptidase
MEVTPLAMANAYATLAAHGTYCKPIVILDIVDRDGNQVPVPDAGCKKVLKRDVADTVTVMLNGVVDGSIPGRTGEKMSLEKRQVAGKTGTTNDSAAVWFCGFTPQVAAAVWVGDPRGGYAHPMKDVTVNGVYYPQVFGGTLPGPIWHDAMEGYLTGTEPVPFTIKNSYGLTSKDPSVYVPPVYTAPKPSKPARPEPPTFDNSDPAIAGTPAPAPAEPAPAEPAPAEPAPAASAAPAAG